MSKYHVEFEDSLLKGVGRPFFKALGQRLQTSEARISFLAVRTVEEEQKREQVRYDTWICKIKV